MTQSTTEDARDDIQPAGEQRDTGGVGRAAELRARLVPPMPNDRILGWLGPALAAVVAGILRFVNLDNPHRFVFDETYYAKDAYSLLNHGYAVRYVEGADDKILDGSLDGLFTGDPSFVVHPEVGKWMIALGEWAFGMNPFGWRFVVALVGTLTVLVLARAARRLTRSSLLGTTAGLLLALDGLSIVTSRTAILDGLLTFWVVLAFALLLIDRDWARDRYANWAEERLAAGLDLGRGPLLLWRPWRLAAGLALGLAIGTKWSGAYVLAAFGLLTVFWEIGARRVLMTRRPVFRTFALDAPVAFVTMVGSAVATYVISWAGWIIGDNGWSRTWAATRPGEGLAALVPDWARSLWHYHSEMWDFHTNLSAEHPYESAPWGWLVMARPVAFEYEGIERGEAGCTVARCSQEITALGTPVLWWAATLALLVVLWMWLGRRDWRAGAVLNGVAATYLPWFAYLDRTVFSFYAVVIAPFMVLALTLVLGLMLGPPGARPARRAVGAAVSGGIVVAVLVTTWYFYPILVFETIPYDEWANRMWFSRWI